MATQKQNKEEKTIDLSKIRIMTCNQTRGLLIQYEGSEIFDNTTTFKIKHCIENLLENTSEHVSQARRQEREEIKSIINIYLLKRLNIADELLRCNLTETERILSKEAKYVLKDVYTDIKDLLSPKQEEKTDEGLVSKESLNGIIDEFKTTKED
jgi:hypothetical protein